MNIYPEITTEKKDDGTYKVFDAFGNRLGTIDSGDFYPKKFMVSPKELRIIADLCVILKNG